MQERQPQADGTPGGLENFNGKMQEWFNWHAWRACVRESVPRVRISLFPQCFTFMFYGAKNYKKDTWGLLPFYQKDLLGITPANLLSQKSVFRGL